MVSDMDVEYTLGLLIIVLGVAAWGYTRYKAMAADGEISLGEIIDAVEDGVEVIEEAIEDAKELKEE